MHWRITVIVLLLLLIRGASFAEQPHTLTGDVRLHKDFHSNILNNERNIIVYLPPGYDTSKTQRYAVFYMHDGQNLFDGATSFIPGQEWRVDETAEALIKTGRIEPLIIVGIYNTGVARVSEYTAAQDPKYKAGGKADLYGRFLVEELKPFIDKTYRTKSDAQHTGVGGSSLGGLISLYLGLKYPTVFTRIAVVSPAVWWADNHIVRFAENQSHKPPLRIWLDIGTKEGRDVPEAQRTVEGARLLKTTLIRKGWKDEKDLKYFEAEGAEHNEKAWAARTPEILKFLFPKKM
ncbi:MAG TPA: alpha/beta hydrolase-fold protein [Pyrinomonadaceae bacterium]|jgi:predicted alpha/beta superfamily hydrolase|nr:alpha/beta hydrolase-fold protein [Pyrinomonadaceae bacterium]